MSVARLSILLGVVACVIGGIFFVLPGNFVYSQMITSYIVTYGNLVSPGLASNPNLAFYIQKSPTFIFVLVGLLLVIAGLYHGINK